MYAGTQHKERFLLHYYYHTFAELRNRTLMEETRPTMDTRMQLQKESPLFITPFQIVSRSGFSNYIVFATRLEIYYV